MSVNCPICEFPFLRHEICCLNCKHPVYPNDLPNWVYITGIISIALTALIFPFSPKLTIGPSLLAIIIMLYAGHQAIQIKAREKQIKAVISHRNRLNSRGVAPHPFQVWKYEVRAFCERVPHNGPLPHHLNRPDIDYWYQTLITARQKISIIYPNIKQTEDADLAPLHTAYEQYGRSIGRNCESI